MAKREPFYLAGATASGKSGVALALARLCDGVIVNADAFQLYRGLSVISAQPDEKALASAPHRLYGVWPLSETADAARYAAEARRVISEIQSVDKKAIITGGSGLYMKSLTHGLSDLPRDGILRAELEKMDVQDRLDKLRSLDVESWRRIDSANDRYVTRALEISLLTGRPASTLRREWEERPVSFDGAVLVRDRADLHGRIGARVQAMCVEGAVEEALHVKDVSLTAEKAIGFREWRACGLGEIPLDEAVALVQQATRQYAKRQETWYRRESGFVPVSVSSVSDDQTLAEEICRCHPSINL